MLKALGISNKRGTCSSKCLFASGFSGIKQFMSSSEHILKYFTKRIKHSCPCINVLPSPSVIMCCSAIRETVRAAIHYYTRAWQHVNTRKRMFYRHCYTLNRSNKWPLFKLIFLTKRNTKQNEFLPKCVNFNGQMFSGVSEKFSFIS